MRDGIARLSRLLDHPAILPGVVLAGVIFAIAQGLAAQSGAPTAVYDTHSYWLAGGADHPYASTITSGFDDSINLYKYRYPPPLAQLFVPLHALPWPVVAALWVAFCFVVFVVLAGRWALVLLLFPATLGELWLGNINLLIGLAIVVGMRWPAAWAFVFLTKVTPGIGVLWFAVRGEWRSLGIVIVATAVLAGVSFALAPSWWFEFRDAMTVQAGAALDVPPSALQIALPIRLVVAAVVVVYAARADRAWLVPVAATIAAPALWGNVFVILVAAVPLAEGRRLDLPLIWRQRGRRGRTAGIEPSKIASYEL